MWTWSKPWVETHIRILRVPSSIFSLLEISIYLVCNMEFAVSTLFVLSALTYTIGTVTEVALILDHKWSEVHRLPQYNIHQDPLRKNLRRGEDSPDSPSSCHYYQIDRSCGPTIEQSVICVECSSSSECTSRHGHYYKVLGEDCRGLWLNIGYRAECTCSLNAGNYIFV